MRPGYFRELGTHLRSARRAAGMTQHTRATRTGMHQSHISAVEIGTTRCGRDLTIRIATVLGLDPAELLRLAGHDAG